MYSSGGIKTQKRIAEGRYRKRIAGYTLGKIRFFQIQKCRFCFNHLRTRLISVHLCSSKLNYRIFCVFSAQNCRSSKMTPNFDLFRLAIVTFIGNSTTIRETNQPMSCLGGLTSSLCVCVCFLFSLVLFAFFVFTSVLYSCSRCIRF